jgi:hypothetical protein
VQFTNTDIQCQSEVGTAANVAGSGLCARGCLPVPQWLRERSFSERLSTIQPVSRAVLADWVTNLGERQGNDW